MSSYLKQPVLARSAAEGDFKPVRQSVASVIADIRARGDVAVREYSKKFDNWDADTFKLDEEQIEKAVDSVSAQAVEDIKAAQARVRTFAEQQLKSLSDFEIEIESGVYLGQKSIPIAAAGAYVPGGRYPMVASAHMSVVPAKVAGVERVTACTPPSHGEIPAATVAALYLAGADEIFVLGGTQAITAMALGTETMGKVDLLAGPGNPYVAEAKRQLFGEVGIDLLAGPTEVLIIADEHADPFVVAVDLLSQAEHGPDSPAILITSSDNVAHEAIEHVDQLLVDMPTKDFAEPAWRDHGTVIVVSDLSEAYELADSYASEHVQILTDKPREALDKMRNYGAIFLGEGTCVSYGDKIIGTNHILPTRGAANYTGGLWPGKYLKTVTYQEITDTKSSAALGEFCGRAARLEHFEGHARSGDVRAYKYGQRSLTWAPVDGVTQ
jgi:sulfopropanediol 3-dehydrogenase